MRVARRLGELPLIRDEFASGRLSYSKVRALSRVAQGAMEEDLIELAQSSTAAQLETLMRAYRRATRSDDEIAAERRHLTTFWDADGTLGIRGNLPADEGALLLKALEIAREELLASCVADAEAAEAGGEFTEPPAKPTNADALMALAETVVSHGVEAASGGDRHQVVVHIDASASAPGHTGGGSAEPPAPSAPPAAPAPPRPAKLDIERASVADVPLSPDVTRRLACDASIVTLVEADGVPLSVGRKTRSIPPAIRRALASRDRCCAFPGCEQERFVDAHHIVHWADGGETSLDNLMLLCRRHHRLVHEGGVRIEGPAGAPRFRLADGTALERSPKPPAKPHPPGLPGIYSDPDPPWGRGEPMDLDLAVFVLANRHERRLGDGGRGGHGAGDASAGAGDDPSGHPPPHDDVNPGGP